MHVFRETFANFGWTYALVIIHSVLIGKDTEFMKFILFYHLIPKMVLSHCCKFNSNKLLINITICKLSSLLLDYINSEKRVSNKEVFDKLPNIPKTISFKIQHFWTWDNVWLIFSSETNWWKKNTDVMGMMIK